jgi:sulfoxide reductase catalytic subunit YedY
VVIMLVKKPSDIPYSNVTPKSVYVNRRRFLKGAAAGAALVAAKPLWDMAAPRAEAQSSTASSPALRKARTAPPRR